MPPEPRTPRPLGAAISRLNLELPFFPRYGKIPPAFSTVWKKVFHSVEKTRKSFPYWWKNIENFFP
jgi:hypothetical protein